MNQTSKPEESALGTVFLGSDNINRVIGIELFVDGDVIQI